MWRGGLPNGPSASVRIARRVPRIGLSGASAVRQLQPLDSKPAAGESVTFVTRTHAVLCNRNIAGKPRLRFQTALSPTSGAGLAAVPQHMQVLQAISFVHLINSTGSSEAKSHTK